MGQIEPPEPRARPILKPDMRELGVLQGQGEPGGGPRLDSRNPDGKWETDVLEPGLIEMGQSRNVRRSRS